MAGILTVDQYLGGPDQIQVEQVFPSNQRTLVYNFNRDITGWTFASDYQTLIVDEIQFNRASGKPNFGNSTILGSFPKVDIAAPYVPEIINAALGTVNVHLPAQMYTGPIIPDARQNVPITIFALTWTDNLTPPQVNTHRWALIQAWEPDVIVGDPTLSVDYTALTVG